MRQLELILQDKKYAFLFHRPDQPPTVFVLDFEELSALDTLVTILQKSGGLTKNPVIYEQRFMLDIDKLFEKIDRLFPGSLDENLPPVSKEPGGHYV